MNLLNNLRFWMIWSLQHGCVVQLALEPLWKLYEVCVPGADADVKATMSKAVKSLNLTQVTYCCLLLLDTRVLQERCVLSFAMHINQLPLSARNCIACSDTDAFCCS